MSKKTIESEGTRISPDPVTNNTLYAFLRQGTNLVVTRQQFISYNQGIQPDQDFGKGAIGASAQELADFGYAHPNEVYQPKQGLLQRVSTFVGALGQSKRLRALGAAYVGVLTGLAGGSVLNSHTPQTHATIAEAAGNMLDFYSPLPPGKTVDLSIGSSPLVLPTLQAGDVIRSVVSGQEYTWSVIHKGANPRPILNQIVPIDYNSPSVAITDATLAVNNYLALPIINNHPEDYTFVLLTKPTITNANCNPQNQCDVNVFNSTVDNAVSAGMNVDENEFMRSKSITGWATVTDSLDRRQTPKSYVAFGVPTGNPANLAFKVNLATEKAHFYTIPDPIPGSDDDKNSLMGSGSGMGWTPWQATLLEGILSSNNHNPAGRSAHPTQVLPYDTVTSGNANKVLSSALHGMDMAAVINPDDSVTQEQIELLPFNNDGPAGLSVIRATPAEVQADREIGELVHEPVFGQGPYNLLPDMGYTWQVWTSPLLNISLSKNDPRWGVYGTAASHSFREPMLDVYAGRTPKTDSTTISAVTPKDGTVIHTTTPVLQWTNTRPNIFYYEVQVTTKENRDPNGEFIADPSRAIGPLTWELIHGGLTNPLDSYTVKPQYPLLPGTEDCWRVRPRIQGDGTPVAWGTTSCFTVAADAVAKAS